MERCANTESLNRHEDELKQESIRQEAFNQEVTDELYSLFEELENKYQLIGEKFGYSSYELDTFKSHIDKEW